MNKILLGLVTPLIVYTVITILHIVIPIKRIKGYVKGDDGEVLNYRVNGIFVLLASVAIWFTLGIFDIVPFTWLYEVKEWSLLGAIVIGLAYSFFMVLKHPSTGKSFLQDMWFGRSKNPQLKNSLIDAKIWLYLIGAVMLELNVLSFAAYHYQTFEGNTNIGFFIGCGMLTWFCFEYLTFEKVHLWTYDFIAERVGFKLGFGCLAFYPYFYSIALWFTADMPNPENPLWLSILFGVLYLFGWTLTRGANMQKFFFKTAPDKKFLWIQPEALTNGTHSLLVNGFWGASRHINYLGEIIQGIAVALAAGQFTVWLGWIGWLYPAYYIALLFTRQLDDNKICKAKYGELWDEYTKRVKYRIIPFIY